MKTQRWLGCFLTVLMLCLLLCSCGMNQEKAIEQMRQALLTSSTMESGKLSAQMTAQVELGADSIPMELAIEGEFQDQLQTMAMQISGEIMGQPIQTQTYQKDGFSYTLDEASGNYIKMPAATAGLDYRQLATLGQDKMVEVYAKAAEQAQDFTFTEEEKGLRVQFTMPQEQLDAMQQQMSSMMNDQLLPAMEQQLRTTVQQQVDQMLESMGQGQALEVDREQLQALIDQQVQMVLEMERKLFDSLKIGSLSCDMLIEGKEINDQTIRMELEFALKELVAALQPDGTELEQLPESCKLSMEIHSLIQQRNEEFAIEMPDLSQAVSIES
ncbi:MAG: hypothetical protein UEP78_02755 [Negativibacillus sp.]|nr:hypothetical protein [Negativibacillus sp.]